MESFASLQLTRFIVTTKILIGVIHSLKTSGELGTALHYVPVTSTSIVRFPEKGSKYYGRLQNFKSVVFNGNETALLVTVSDAVSKIDIETFEIENGNSSSNVLFIPANPQYYAKCYKFMHEKIDCNNTMLFAVYDGATIFACGTYSLQGRCWRLSPNKMKVLKVVPGEFSDRNEFAPKKPSGKIVGLTASNGVIFGAIEKANSYTIRAILKSNVHIRTGSPAVQLSAPTFVASFEADDGFIYFFFTENAYEVSERQMVYSRVGRVCSFDKGSQYEFEFTTFTKSQIVCYKKGRVPDYYDHIQSATTVEVRDKSGKPEVFIYASFTTTIGSTGSSALCRYKMKDIQKLFQTSPYYVKKNENGKVKYEPQKHPQPKLDVSRMKCNSKLNSDKINGDGVKWISLNPLLFNDIEPYDKNTVTTFRGERVTSLAVESVHQDINRSDSGVYALFAGTASGKVLKVVTNDSNAGEPYIAEEIQATKKPTAITVILLHKDYVIGSGNDMPLVRISKERCESKYLMCSDCLKARDPYCAWSLSMKKCTRAANLTPLDRLQDVATGSDKKCPPVDVTISCSLVIVDNVPGAWTTIQCTGHGKISPQVIAWKKDEARLDINHNIYEIRRINDSSQVLVIKSYTRKELGKYGCIVGLNSNKSECSVHIKASTAKPTTVKLTSKTPGKMTRKRVTTGSMTQKTTTRTLQTTSKMSTNTTFNPPTPGPRVNCPKDQSGKWFVAFMVCFVVLILIVLANIFFLCCFVLRRKEHLDEEDEFDGTKGKLAISPSKKSKGDFSVLFRKRRRVEKKDSTKPLVKRESNNGRAHSDPDDSGKTAKEMDDIPPSEDKPSVYLMHVKA